MGTGLSCMPPIGLLHSPRYHQWGDKQACSVIFTIFHAFEIAIVVLCLLMNSRAFAHPNTSLVSKVFLNPSRTDLVRILKGFARYLQNVHFFLFFVVGGFCPMALRWRFNEHPTHLKEYIGSCRKHRIRYERKWYFFTWMLIQPFFDCCDVLDGTIAYFNKDEEDSWFNSGAIHGAPFCQIHMFSLEEDVTHHRGFEKGDVATNSEHSHLVKLSPFLLTFPTDAKDPPTSLVVTPVLGENLFFPVNIIFSSL